LEAQEGRAGTLSNQFASILAPAGFRRRQIGAVQGRVVTGDNQK